MKYFALVKIVFLQQFIYYYYHYCLCLHKTQNQITTAVVGQLQNYIKAQENERKLNCNAIQQIKSS